VVVPLPVVVLDVFGERVSPLIPHRRFLFRWRAARVLVRFRKDPTRGRRRVRTSIVSVPDPGC
jgi:hypothetical protein